MSDGPFPVGAKVRYKDASVGTVYTVKACVQQKYGDGTSWWKVWYVEGGFDNAEDVELAAQKVRRFHAFTSGGGVGLWESADGDWVLWSDHVAAVTDAENAVRNEILQRLREAMGDK